MDQKLVTGTVDIDLAKAFDTVSHTKLLHKLPWYIRQLEREPRTVIHVKRAKMFDPMG